MAPDSPIRTEPPFRAPMTVRLPFELITRLWHQRAKTGRTLQAMIEEAIRGWLDAQEDRP